MIQHSALSFSIEYHGLVDKTSRLFNYFWTPAASNTKNNFSSIVVIWYALARTCLHVHGSTTMFREIKLFKQFITDATKEWTSAVFAKQEGKNLIRTENVNLIFFLFLFDSKWTSKILKKFFGLLHYASDGFSVKIFTNQTKSTFLFIFRSPFLIWPNS